MPRVRKPQQPVQLALAVESSPPEAPTGSRRRAMPAAPMNRAVRELAAFVQGNDFKAARGIHFVALYLQMHLECYGVEAADCGPDARLAAAGLANNMLARDFAGDGEKMADFVAWVWTRERRAEVYRKEQGRSGRRITWRLQFGSQLLTDFKVEAARNHR